MHLPFIRELIEREWETLDGTTYRPVDQFRRHPETEPTWLAALNAAFLIRLEGNSRREPVAELMARAVGRGAPEEAARFYVRALELIAGETTERPFPEDPGPGDLITRAWRVFFPEGLACRADPKKAIASLRQRRTVEIVKPNPTPIEDPCREILFVTNVVVTRPSDLGYQDSDEEIARAIADSNANDTATWQDGPIPIDASDADNPIHQGLRALDGLVASERASKATSTDRISLLVTVSATHKSLLPYAKRIVNRWLEAEQLDNITIYIVAQRDIDSLVEHVLVPAARNLSGKRVSAKDFAVLGVDGPAGRAHSFGYAIAAFWQTVIDPNVKAVFKIDLGRTFFQTALDTNDHRSAFEPLTTDLWGSTARDHRGREIDLSMIVAAQRSGHRSPQDKPGNELIGQFEPRTPGDHIFFHILPKGLSVEAEMGAKPGAPPLDSPNHALQRFHITGGGAGLLISALFRHRPFTPSLIGHAEEQAYLLSTFKDAWEHRLGGVHSADIVVDAPNRPAPTEDERLAGIVSDIERILLFSAYVRYQGGNNRALMKAELSPYVGAFVRERPVTIAVVRFAMIVARLFAENPAQASPFMLQGLQRLNAVITAVAGRRQSFVRSIATEKEGWARYYDTFATWQGVGEIGYDDLTAIADTARTLVTTWQVHRHAEAGKS